MGIYVGNGWMVHSSDRGTTLTPMTGWYETRFAWGRNARWSEAGNPLLALRRYVARRDVRARRRSLRAHALPPLRPERAEAPRDLARPLVELRARPPTSRRAARSCAARSTSASRTSTSRTTTGRRTAPPRRTSGALLREDLRPFRDELVISTKAGYDMWPGPYGEWGSRKYLLASLDQSLARMGLDYVDIFYSHRFDPETPLEETMGALDTAVRQGKALYAGISSYSAEKTREAAAILRELGTPLLIHQPSYSMLNRWIEPDLLDALGELGVGCITFSPLAQGMLTDKYLNGIPEGARASRPGTRSRPTCSPTSRSRRSAR